MTGSRLTRTILVLVLLALAWVAIGCGGGGSTGPITEQPATMDVTFQGKVGLAGSTTSAVGSGFTGTGDYPMTPARAETTVLAARRASDLDPGEEFRLLWISVVPARREPQPGVALGPFAAGAVVDLYMCYEVQPGVVLSRWWVIAQAGLSYIERDVEHPEGGVVQAKFTYQLPFAALPYDPPEDPGSYFSLAFSVQEEAGAKEFHYPDGSTVKHAQMAWEDMVSGSDYDYNDFVASMHVVERRNSADALTQIDLVVKGLARGAGYTHNWQFNLQNAFPGSTVRAVVSQFYDTNPDYDYTNDEVHHEQFVWYSSDGASVPVFAPTRDALPGGMTNTSAGTQYVEGDYAKVTMTFDPPVPMGTYVHAPYEPELLVHPGEGNEYALGLWREPGDAVDGNGRPLGFIVPETWPWPLEGRKIWNVYDGFNEWVEWINDQSLPEPSPAWYRHDPVKDYFRRELFTDPHNEGGGSGS